MTNMKAEKGDLIRIVKVMNGTNFVKIGDIYEVSSVSNFGVHVKGRNKHQSDYVADFEYVIHRKAGEEDDDVFDNSYAAQYERLMEEGFEEDSAEVDDLLHEHYSDMAEEIERDAVNSPNHYTQGKFETIEIIEEITKGYSDGYVAYCVGNALKYLARAPFKHGEPSEDLSKAAKYLAFANEYLDAKSTQDLIE